MLVRLRLTRKLPPSRLDSSGEITLKYFPRWYPRRRRGEGGRGGAKEETLTTTTTRIKFITLGEEYIFGAWLSRILSPSVHNSASIKVGQWDFPSTSAQRSWSGMVEKRGKKRADANRSSSSSSSSASVRVASLNWQISSRSRQFTFENCEGARLVARWKQHRKEWFLVGWPACRANRM